MKSRVVFWLALAGVTLGLCGSWPAHAAARYRKVDLSKIGGVAGMRSGAFLYKKKVPLAGDVRTGKKFRIPWFSSNPKHKQRARVAVPGGFVADTLYVLAGCAWWTMGDMQRGKPLLRIRINGDPKRELTLISGKHIWEWNAPAPRTLAKNSKRIRNKDKYTRYAYLTRFTLPKTTIRFLEIELVARTKINPRKIGDQQLIEVFGITLGPSDRSRRIARRT